MKTPDKVQIHRGRVLNAFASPKPENDYTIQIGAPDGVAYANLPDSFDVRPLVSSTWSKPYDQGQTGSCVGQATKGVLHWHLLKEGKLTRPHTRYSPSFRFIWEASKEMDDYTFYPSTMLLNDGTFIKTAVSVLLKHGCCPDSLYNLRHKGIKMNTAEFNSRCADFKIRSYHRVTPHGPGFGMQGYKWWLVNEGPIVTRSILDRKFLTARRGDVLEKYNDAENYGGHAYMIVAYKPGYFLIKNSWGTPWGDRGYLWVSEEYAKLAFTESYGIRL